MKPFHSQTFRNAGCFLLILLLSGCATMSLTPEAVPARDTLADFSLEGRFSLRHDEQNYSGRLNWRHVGRNDELLLSSPFGQGMAEIVTSSNGARLTMSDGKVYEAAEAETLTRQVLGYPLPLTQLTDWVRGRSNSENAQRDALGRLQRLQHEAWSIDYAYESDDLQAPPSRIFAERAGGTELRLRIDQWQSLPTDGARQP